MSLLVFASIAYSAGYVSFTPGPGFTTRVNTPSGNYIVDVEPDGGAAWVGTEDEYINRKAQAVMSAQGYKELRVAGSPKNVHYMVDTRLPSVTVGRITLAQISASIIFDKSPAFDPTFHAPRPRKGYQYAYVGWMRSGGSGFRATLRDTKSGEVIEPFDCQSEACRYQIPETKLGVPLVLIFTAPHSKPAVIPISSLAYSQYLAERDYRLTGEPDGMKWLEALHDIDPAVPSHP